MATDGRNLTKLQNDAIKIAAGFEKALQSESEGYQPTYITATKIGG